MVIAVNQWNVGLLSGLLLAGGLLGTVAYYGTFGNTGSPRHSRVERTRGGYRAGFAPMHESPADGRVTFRPVEGGFRVRVRLRGLDPGARYNTHYHRGTCRQPGGGGIQLNPVLSTEEGTGVSETTVRYGEINATFDHLVMVHDPNQHHILCANVPGVRRLRELKQRMEGSEP